MVTTSSSVPGCARWKSRSRAAGASRRPITSTRSARRPGRTDAAARTSAWRRSRACGRNACPSMVSWAPRAARRAGPGVGAVGCGAGGGGGGGGAAWPVGGVPPQAAGDGGDGPDPVRRADERPRRVRARQAQLRPAPGGVGHRRRGQDRLPGSQRRLPEGACAAGGPARRERAVRVHDLDRHHGRTAARRGRHRAVRPGDNRAGRCRQLPALGRRDLGRRDPGDRRAGVRAGREPAHRGRARRTAGPARVLAARAGLHPARRGRNRARHRRPAWPDHLHGRVQPGARHLPARTHREGPPRPHPVRVVGYQQRSPSRS